MIQKGLPIENKKIITYNTRKEDTLLSICQIFQTNPYSLRELNQQVNLDDLKQNTTLLVEINESKEQSVIANNLLKLQHPDMTFMRKPLFLQVRPPGNPLKLTEFQDIEEYLPKRPKSPLKLDELELNHKVLYVTMNGNIPGLLKIKKNELQFLPQVDELKSILESQANRSIKDISQEIIERYHVRIFLEDIYTVRLAQNDSLEVYVFGVLGVTLPLRDGQDNFGIVKITLLPQKIDKSMLKRNQVQVKKLLQLEEFPKNEGIHLIKYTLDNILNQELYQNQLVSFQQILKKAVVQEKIRQSGDPTANIKNFPEINMGCLSEISLYDIVPVKELEPIAASDKRFNKLNRYRKYDLPTLHGMTKILDVKTFEQIIKQLPEFIQTNDWYLMYAPTQHGTSYEELFRRLNLVGPHILLMRDNQDVVFGAFLTEKWKKMQNKYFGSGDSFAFTFKFSNSIKVYHWTKKNNYFQRADEDGLNIGDNERPAITIHHELIRGTSFPCETFQNDVLASDYNYKIIEMEFWGLSEECELILRHLRQNQAYMEGQY